MRLMVNTCLTYSEKYTGYRKNEDVFVCYFDVIIAVPA